MMQAAILVSTEPRKFSQIAERARAVSGVADTFVVAGRADIVIIAEPRDLKELVRILEGIHGIEGVISTETLLEIPRG